MLLFYSGFHPKWYHWRRQSVGDKGMLLPVLEAPVKKGGVLCQFGQWCDVGGCVVLVYLGWRCQSWVGSKGVKVIWKW